MNKKNSRLNRLFFWGLLLLVTNIKSYSQEKNLWEVGFLGAYFYHLDDLDFAGTNGNQTEFNVDFRIAYYRNPSNLFGFYSSLNLGLGLIERDFPGWGNVEDYSKNQDFIIGTTFNPGRTSKMWFNFGLGINRLVINGEEDYTTYGGGGVTYIGGGLVGNLLNNIGSNGSTTVQGYPEFERFEGALDIGLHIQLLGKLFLYVNYKPILTTMNIKNDFNFGFSIVF